MAADFLAHVLPPDGFRFLVFRFQDGRVVTRHFLPAETPELIKLGTWAARRQADVWFAVGGYGSKPDGATARTAELSALHRCLRIDIDCGEGKPYPDQREGLRALSSFISQSGLPLPTIVDSGYGLHCYWTFDEAVPRATWLLLSGRLAGAMEQLGLQVDTTTTQDAARILRLPGTFNFKHDTQRLVRVLKFGAHTPVMELARTLAAFQPSARSPAAHHSSLNADLTDMGPREPYMLRGVLTGCPGMQRTLQTHGAEWHEPLWKATLDIVSASGETDEVKERVARAISDGHDGFDEVEFERKWEQVKAQAYEPATCAVLAERGFSEICRSCPHNGRIGSPVVLGRDRATATPAPPEPPPVQLQPSGSMRAGVLEFTEGASKVTVVDGRLAPGLQIAHGIVHKSAPDGKDEQGNTIFKMVPVGSYPVLAIEVLADQHGRGTIVAVTFGRWADGNVTVEFSPSEQTDTKAFARQLAAANVRMRTEDVQLWRDRIMNEFLTQIQRLKQSGRLATRNGWTDDFSEFVLGLNLYAKDATPQPVRTLAITEAFAPYRIAGREDYWREAFERAMSEGGARQAVLALSIGAPLFAFTGVDGVMLNAFSPETGVGKSTLCDAALSVWGMPHELRRDAKDTMNATFKLAAATGNLPYVIDEFTNIDGRMLSDFVYTITQGRERHRLSSDARLQENSNRWCLPVIVTSNNSVHDKLQAYRMDAEAEAARVFELRLSPLHVKPGDMAQAKEVMNRLRYNYGFLGPRVVAVMLSRPAEQWRTAIMKRISSWDRTMSTDSGDRFRSAMCAVCELGAELGKLMGLPFDLPAIRSALKSAWEGQREAFKANIVEAGDFAREYLLENMNDIAIFGGPDARNLIREPAHRYRGEIVGRTVNGRYRPDYIVVPTNLLRAYVRDNNGNWRAVQDWISSSSSVLRHGQETIMKGTPDASRHRCVRLSPAIANAMQLITPGEETPDSRGEAGEAV